MALFPPASLRSPHLEDIDSGYNVVMPAPANAIFTNSDERSAVGWLPYLPRVDRFPVQ
jgi:hypothetical protein